MAVGMETKNCRHSGESRNPLCFPRKSNMDSGFRRNDEEYAACGDMGQVKLILKPIIITVFGGASRHLPPN
ncbi:MAG TPA: hypothetical protein VFK31_00240 [Rhodanobacteraceae bacterium]|nr:hypothetical protein [Rhodanobacteraceae bacterium]